MKMNPLLAAAVALLAPVAALHAADTPHYAGNPNIVYLLADDLGWGDLSVNGGSIPTPRTDRLCREGVRLDNFMGWRVCSPTLKRFDAVIFANTTGEVFCRPADNQQSGYAVDSSSHKDLCRMWVCSTACGIPKPQLD